MDFSRRFQINSLNVIFEKFDDEIVLINLDNGNYYSLENVGADIWEFIQEGFTLHDIKKRISSKYESNQKMIDTSIDRFIDEIKKEGLIVLADPDSPGAKKYESINNENDLKNKSKFEEPKLQRYTDMQDLLLLDPIHEVDESGWPNSKSKNSL